MKEQLEAIRAGALAAIGAAGNTGELEALRVQYLGKKGELTAVLKQMGKLSAEERPVMGQLANAVRADVEAAIEAAVRRTWRKRPWRSGWRPRRWTSPSPARTHKLGHKPPHVHRPGRDQGDLHLHGLHGPGRPGGGAGHL